MGNTTDGFGKNRDHNQYGEVEKERGEEKNNPELPKSPNWSDKDKDKEKPSKKPKK